MTSPLLTDLYHLNMIQAYLDHGQTNTPVFEFFVRKLPPRRGFLLAAGLEQALDFLGALHFTGELKVVEGLPQAKFMRPPRCSLRQRTQMPRQVIGSQAASPCLLQETILTGVYER